MVSISFWFGRVYMLMNGGPDRKNDRERSSPGLEEENVRPAKLSLDYHIHTYYKWTGEVNALW